jgi:hypothetical protein
MRKKESIQKSIPKLFMSLFLQFFGENIPTDEFGMIGVNTGMTGVNTGSSTARGEYLRVHVQALTGLTIL